MPVIVSIDGFDTGSPVTSMSTIMVGREAPTEWGRPIRALAVRVINVVNAMTNVALRIATNTVEINHVLLYAATGLVPLQYTDVQENREIACLCETNGYTELRKYIVKI